MAKTARNLTTALAVSTALFTAHPASAAGAPDQATIVIRVDDYATLFSADLNVAETVASRILRTAGIRTVWVRGLKKTDRGGGARTVTLVLLSREMAERKIAADLVGPTVLAQAAGVTGRAYVFVHRVNAIAVRNGRPLGEVLGKVIAHEIGHLLLPGTGHSPTGIMAASLDLRPSADVEFTAEQRAAMAGVILAAR